MSEIMVYGVGAIMFWGAKFGLRGAKFWVILR